MISKRYISSQALKLSVSLLERIKVATNKREVSYQSPIRMWLSEKVDGA